MTRPVLLLTFVLVLPILCAAPSYCGGLLFEPTVDPGLFPTSSQVVTFSERPVGTSSPFTIDDLSFSGAGRVFATAFITSPSGSPVYTTESTPADFVEIDLAKPAWAIGAYFTVQGNNLRADLELELYDDTNHLATFALDDLTSNDRSFFGALSHSTPFNRAIFRNAANNTVSLLMDDVTYSLVPEPQLGSPLLILLITSIVVVSAQGPRRFRSMKLADAALS